MQAALLSHSHRRIALSIFATSILLSGCGPAETPRSDVIRSFDRYLPGLDETVKYVLASRGRGSQKHVVRADGRIRTPGEVRSHATGSYSTPQPGLLSGSYPTRTV